MSKAFGSFSHKIGSYNDDFYRRVSHNAVSGSFLFIMNGENKGITGATEEDVWLQGGTYYHPNSGVPLLISSTSLLDTDPGCAIMVSGLDDAFQIQSVGVVLNGRTPVVVGTAATRWRRIIRTWTSGSVGHSGTVYLYDQNTAVSNGVPSNTNKILATQTLEDQQSSMALYTVPSGYHFHALAFHLVGEGANSAHIAFDLKDALQSGVWKRQWVVRLKDQGMTVDLTTPTFTAEMTDIRFRGFLDDTGSADTHVLVECILSQNGGIA